MMMMAGCGMCDEDERYHDDVCAFRISPPSDAKSHRVLTSDHHHHQHQQNNKDR